MKTEPAAVGVAGAAILNVIVLLVLKHDLGREEQAAAVTAITLLAGLFIRANVSPSGRS